jgi:hypothetical protein
MPSSRSSRRDAAITRRQKANPRASTREIGPDDRRWPVAPLAPILAAAAAADRTEADAERAEIRRVRREIENQKREARKAGDQDLVAKLNELSRRFDAAARRPGTLDRFPR